MRKGFFAGLLVAVGILAPPKARAQDEHARADALYRQGAAAAQRGEHDRAYAAFSESYRLWPRGATLGNVGWAEVELGHLLEGFGHLKQAARAQDLNDHRRAVIQQNIDEVYARIGHLAIDADQGATVTVDGTAVAGVAPFGEPIDVLPGRRAIEATFGTRTTRAVADADAGTVVRVDLRAPLAMQDASASPATEMLASDPLFMQGREGPAAPQAASSWWSLPRALGMGLGGVALASAGTALAFAAASQAAADDARNLRAKIGPNACASVPANAECANLKDRVNAVHTDDSIAQASVVVGGVAAVGAAIAFVVAAQHDDAAHTPTVGWTVGPASGAVWGRF